MPVPMPSMVGAEFEVEAEKEGSTLVCAMVNRSEVITKESIRTTTDSCGLEELAQVNNLEEAKWTLADSEKLCRVQGWGSPYYFVSPQGHACVRLFSLPDDGAFSSLSFYPSSLFLFMRLCCGSAEALHN
ncbi:unnamed protein product [Calypogeia fissa]